MRDFLQNLPFILIVLVKKSDFDIIVQWGRGQIRGSDWVTRKRHLFIYIHISIYLSICATVTKSSSSQSHCNWESNTYVFDRQTLRWDPRKRVVFAKEKDYRVAMGKLESIG